MGVTVANADAIEFREPPGSDSPFCVDARAKAHDVLPVAQACERDSDCFHYPCSCSALGSSPAADEYIALEEVLWKQCGDPAIFAYCGPTDPVCEDGVCTVREKPDPKEMWLVRVPDLRGLERAASASITASFARALREDLASLRATPSRYRSPASP